MNTSTHTTSAIELDALCEALCAEGVSATPSQVAALAQDARAAGVPSVLIALMCDAAEPMVARLRAYGRIAAEVWACGERGGVDGRNAVVLAA